MVVGIAQQRGLAELGHVALRYGKSGCDALWCGYYKRRTWGLNEEKTFPPNALCRAPKSSLPVSPTVGQARVWLPLAELAGAEKHRASSSFGQSQGMPSRVARASACHVASSPVFPAIALIHSGL